MAAARNMPATPLLCVVHITSIYCVSLGFCMATAGGVGGLGVNALLWHASMAMGVESSHGQRSRHMQPYMRDRVSPLGRHHHHHYHYHTHIRLPPRELSVVRRVQSRSPCVKRCRHFPDVPLRHSSFSGTAGQSVLDADGYAIPETLQARGAGANANATGSDTVGRMVAYAGYAVVARQEDVKTPPAIVG